MILKILLGTVLGTTLMTIFSYIIAEITEKQFKEPVLLNRLVDRFPNLEVDVSSKSLIGWILHYGMGLFFLITYYLLWKYTFIEPTILYGILLGFVSGIVGITVWKVTFSVHPNPPSVDLEKYFIHLLIAHIIFGIGAVLGYNIF